MNALPEGKLLYTISAALAEWERSILSKRTKEGMEAARLRGSRIGRPLKLLPEQMLWAEKQFNEGKSIRKTRQVCCVLDVSQQTLKRAMKLLTYDKQGGLFYGD